MIKNALGGLARAKLWLADGTFKAVPFLFFQNYSIHFELALSLIPAAIYCLVRSHLVCDKSNDPHGCIYTGDRKMIFKCKVHHFYTVSQKETQ